MSHKNIQNWVAVVLASQKLNVRGHCGGRKFLLTPACPGAEGHLQTSGSEPAGLCNLNSNAIVVMFGNGNQQTMNVETRMKYKPTEPKSLQIYYANNQFLWTDFISVN